MLPEWLSWYTNSPQGRRYFQSCAKRTTNLASINMTELKACTLPVPVIEEQRALISWLAKTLDLLGELRRNVGKASATEQLARQSCLHALVENGEWDRVRDNWESLFTTPESIDDLRKAILDLAVRGRLVEQRGEDAKTDLDALEGRKQSRIKEWNLKRLPEIEAIPDETPHRVPEQWTWCRLGTLARVQAGFSFKSTGFNEGERGLPLIRIRDLGSKSTETYYDGEYRSEFLVNPGDYLVGMDGVFKVKMWRGPLALLNQRVARLQFYSDQVIPRLVVIALHQELAGLQGSKSYTTVDHLSNKQISNVLVPLPPLAEQHRIVAKVDELMALSDELEARLRKVAEISEQLAESVVHHSAA